MEKSLADLSSLSHIETTSVYAILLLLSRLYPSFHDFVDTEEEKSSLEKTEERQKNISSMSASPFVPLIQKCARLPNSLVRRIFTILYNLK